MKTKEFDMFLFIHEGKGHYIGSTVMVLAPTRTVAKKMIRRVLDEHGLKDEKVAISSIVNTTTKQVVYINDGDY